MTTLEHVPQCWSCSAVLDGTAGKQGVSLDGGETLHVCTACWKSLSTAERIQFQLVARPVELGGLGIKELAENAAAYFALEYVGDDDGNFGPWLLPGHN